MKSIICFSLPLILVFSYFFLFSQEEKESNGEVLEYPFSFLDPEKIDKIHIGNAHESVVLEKRIDDWYITDPFEFRSSIYLVSAFLEELKTISVAKVLTLDEKQADHLNLSSLSDSRKTEVTLYHGDRVETSFTLGDFDLPEDISDAPLIGLNTLARRFLRMKSPEEVDLLISSSLASCDPNTAAWQDISVIIFGRFQKFEIQQADKVRIFTRDEINGSVYYEKPDGREEIDPMIFKEMEFFLERGGVNGKAVPINENTKEGKELFKIRVQDFEGLAYHLDFFSVRPLNENEILQQQLFTNMINSGAGSEKFPVKVRVNWQSPDEINEARSSLMKKIETAQQLQDYRIEVEIDFIEKLSNILSK